MSILSCLGQSFRVMAVPMMPATILAAGVIVAVGSMDFPSVVGRSTKNAEGGEAFGVLRTRFKSIELAIGNQGLVLTNFSILSYRNILYLAGHSRKPDVLLWRQGCGSRAVSGYAQHSGA